ncbi:hypothetical protein BaRGS_00019121 [Batillaria attramentaria]|uniref:Uncharacterized protein n=1 Tax=Batillaria attramentaria TaxID=370345 RepID=A0ABD0KRV3_9CAEN
MGDLLQSPHQRRANEGTTEGLGECIAFYARRIVFRNRRKFGRQTTREDPFLEGIHQMVFAVDTRRSLSEHTMENRFSPVRYLVPASRTRPQIHFSPRTSGRQTGTFSTLGWSCSRTVTIKRAAQG